MNIKSVAAAAGIVLSSGSAFAQQIEFVAPDASFHSSMTRAEVRNQLIEAETIGKTAWQMYDGQDSPSGAGILSRAEVRSQLIDAENVGKTAWQMHDGQDTAPRAGILTRKQVRAEAVTALQMHHTGDVDDFYFGG
jgi:hypothetical protein